MLACATLQVLSGNTLLACWRVINCFNVGEAKNVSAEGPNIELNVAACAYYVLHRRCDRYRFYLVADNA